MHHKDVVGLAALALVIAAFELLPSQSLLAEARRNLWFVAREMWGVSPYLLLSVAVSAWAQTANVHDALLRWFRALWHRTQMSGIDS